MFMKIKKTILVSAGCILISITMTACGQNKQTENTTAGTETDMEQKMEEMRGQFMYLGESVIGVSHPGNYVIDGVELCDAAEAPQDVDDTWEGYSEAELGFLRPERMPNCIVDEAGNHWVLYNGVMYTYVNDHNSQYGDASPFIEYANVWCSMDSSNRQFLGDLEEYGRKCAQEGKGTK